MPTVEIPNKRKYTKAIGILLKSGRFFRTKPTRQFVVDPGQLQALQEAGLVSANIGAKNRGKKKS